MIKTLPEELIKFLKVYAETPTVTDDRDIPYDAFWCQQRDDYYVGETDGETHMARRVLEVLEIPYTIKSNDNPPD